MVDSLESEDTQHGASAPKRPRTGQPSMGPATTGTTPTEVDSPPDEDYLRQQQQAWDRQSSSAHGYDGRDQAAQQAEWEAQELDRQQELWEQVQRQRRAERDAKEYRAWEDWTFHNAMQDRNRRPRVRMTLQLPEGEPQTVSLELPDNGIPPGTMVSVQFGDPDPNDCGTAARRLERIQSQWRRGTLTNEEVVRQTNDATLLQWQTWEMQAYRRRRLFDGGPRDDRHRGTPWYAEHYGPQGPWRRAGHTIGGSDASTLPDQTTRNEDAAREGPQRREPPGNHAAEPRETMALMTEKIE